jgi:hypothetical protein
MIKLGATSISSAKLGATQVSKIYLGSTEVWANLDSDVDAFVLATGATDTTTMNALALYLKAQSLWTSCRFFPFKSTQNYATGTSVKGLGGWTSNDIALFGSVANPTTAGRAFDATDDRGTWDGTGIELLSELYVFSRSITSAASLAENNRIGYISIGDNSIPRALFLNAGSSAITGETTGINLNNASPTRFGITDAWSAVQDLQIVFRLVASGTDIWFSKSNTTDCSPQSGSLNFAPSSLGWSANSIVNISAIKNGAAYIYPSVGETRKAILFCKTSLTTLQRETITDYLDAL